MNLVLIGYRGTGKSVVAHEAAAALGWEVLSLDATLVERAGMSIPEIVEERGWEGFRDLEEEIVRSVACLEGFVIDCGGGVIERQANHSLLRQVGMVVWLTASPATIVNRIRDDDQRPSLTGNRSFVDEVEEVLSRRLPLYRAVAHHEVCTDGRTIAEVAAQVIDLVRAAE